MRSIRHAAPSFYKTLNPSHPRYDLSKPVQDSLHHQKGITLSSKGKGKRKRAMDVQSQAQSLEAPEQIKSPPQAMDLARHPNMSSDPIPRLREGDATIEPPINSQKSKYHRPVISVTSALYRRKQSLSYSDHLQEFFDTPRLSPLPAPHTEPLTIETYTRLYSPRYTSPAFRPKVSESISTSKKMTVTRQRRASWLPLSRAVKHTSGASPQATRTQLPVLYFNLPKLPSSHRRVNVTPKKLWDVSPHMSPLDIFHKPLPLSHGSGEVDKRAERYRKAIHMKEKSAQSVLHGLGGREAREGRGSSCANGGGNEEDLKHSEDSFKMRSSSITTTSTRPDSNVSSKFASRRRGPLLSGSDSASNRAALIPSLAIQRPRRYTCRQYTSGQEHSSTSIKSHPTSAESTPSKIDFGSISGFSVGWKGDEWKYDWGEDRLVSPGSQAPPRRIFLLPRVAEHINHRQSRFGLPRGILRPRSKVTRLLPPVVLPPPLLIPVSHSLGQLGPEQFRDLETGKVLPPSSLARRLRVIDQAGNLGAVYRRRGKSRLKSLRGHEENQVDHSGVPPKLLISGPPPIDKQSQTITSRLNQRLEHLAAIGAITREAIDTEKAMPPIEPLTNLTRYSKLGALVARMTRTDRSSVKSVTGTATGTEYAAAHTEVVLSRRAVKAKALAAKIKAKRDITSRLTPAHSRKEARAMRKKKKADALKSLVTGHLKHLATGESVLQDIQPPQAQRPIARLAHGLDRVLFNQSVHWLQDPHSRVFNFSPVLQALPAVTDFAFERIPPYVSSSRDEDLHTLALRHSKQFAGSTSSLTKLLSHIYFLISGDRLVDTSTLSMAFVKEPRTFTPGLRLPATFVLHHRENQLDKHGEPVLSASLGKEPSSPDVEHAASSDANEVAPVMHTYAIDSGLGDPNERREAELNVLLWLGTMAEKFLTMPEQAFSALLRKNPGTAALPEDKRPEAYRYSKSSKFVMRSQLDCQDSRLPGTGVFDIKTRAALPIRIDQLNYQENSGYLIRKMTGLYESFEREYYDLIRSAFLKYNFQAKIGNMDGVFVAYHNTARMFGFQYVPVREMEERLYGPGSPDRGDRIFGKCVELMEALVKEIVDCFPGESLSCTVEAREGAGFLRAWVVPLVWTKDEPKPVAELRVSVSHTINDHPVSSKTAIDRANENWVLVYHIHRVHSTQSQIWAALRETQARQFSLALPEGVAGDEMRSKLANVDYGAGHGLQLKAQSTQQVVVAAAATSAAAAAAAAAAADGTKEKIEPPFSKQFRKPSRNVRHLRQLAKAGWAELEREAELEAQPVVWGRDFDAGWVAEPSPETTALEDSKEASEIETWEGPQEDESLEGEQDNADVMVQGAAYHATSASDQDVRDGTQELSADQPIEETSVHDSQNNAPP